MPKRQQAAPHLSQICNIEPISMLMDKFAGQMHHSNPSLTCHHVLHPYMPKNDEAMKEQSFLVISHMPCTYIAIAATSNLWIIPSNPRPEDQQ